MLDNSGQQIVSAINYDDKAQPVQIRSNNILNGYDKEYLAYNFTGQPVRKRHIHSSTTVPYLQENYTYYYDHAGRQTSTRHKLNMQAEFVLDSMRYDEPGRLSTKILHGGIQTINYTYNVRGWLKSISSPNFNETLYYQDKLNGQPSYYNGNISATTFGTGHNVSLRPSTQPIKNPALIKLRDFLFQRYPVIG